MFKQRMYLPFVAALALAGCGGSGGSDQNSASPPPPSARAVTTVGQITGFGSVYVNGVRYSTTGAAYRLDDGIASDDSALSVGMVVMLKGRINSDGQTGVADEIYYDDEIEGVVQNVATDAGDPSIKTFMIWGQSVQVNESTTRFDNEDDPSFSFETIMNLDVVEVSGQYADGVLIASYIEKQDALDDDVEAKGTVDQYDGVDQFVLLLRNGTSLAVTLAPGAEIPSTGIENGQYVEVEGTIPDPTLPDELLAIEVELEDEDRLGDDDDDIEIKGMLSYDDVADSWSVRDVPLTFDGGTEYDPESLRSAIADGSANGLTVEVEGEFVDGFLVVDAIEIEDDDELEFKASVESITATGPKDGTITLAFGNATGTVDVVITGDTMFLNDYAMAQFDLREVNMGQMVEIDARFGDDGRIYASSLQLENDREFEIKGPVGTVDSVSITIVGVTFGLDQNTFYEGGTPIAGDVVEVEDDDADGNANSVEIED